MAKKTSYSFKTGAWKSAKNLFLTVGIPALILLADNWTQWIPDEYNAVAAPLMGLAAYFIKNYAENK